MKRAPSGLIGLLASVESQPIGEFAAVLPVYGRENEQVTTASCTARLLEAWRPACEATRGRPDRGSQTG
jgi:hypothetical protein